MAVTISSRQNRYLSITRILVMICLVALILQYFLGMYVNLFAALPVGNPICPTPVHCSYAGDGEFLFHFILGFVLSIVGIVTIVFASLTRRLNLITLSALGLVGIVFAGISGIFFLDSLYANNAYSYSMSIFFLVSVISFAIMTSAVRKKNFSVVQIDRKARSVPQLNRED
jgi:hypothetical protein